MSSPQGGKAKIKKGKTNERSQKVLKKENLNGFKVMVNCCKLVVKIPHKNLGVDVEGLPAYVSGAMWMVAPVLSNVVLLDIISWGETYDRT